MEVTQLSQKEYLKKYLSNSEDKKKKKKKKSTKNAQERFRVVDDDIDLKNMRPLDEDEIDLYNLAEDAPQIAGIIDERPDEMRTLEEFRGSKRWKIMSDENGDNDIKIIPIGNTVKQQDDKKVTKPSDSNSSPSKKYNDSDTSPPRKSRSRPQSESDSSPPRNACNSDKDQSPPRKLRKRDGSNSSSSMKNKMSPTRRSKDFRDPSPVRRKKHEYAFSPIIRNRYNMNQSPVRKSRYEQDKPGMSPRKTKADASPIERNKHISDLSPPRRSKQQNDSDSSPPRRIQRSDSDQSPPRSFNKQERNNRRREIDSDVSPHRKSARHYGSPSGKDNSRSTRRKSLTPSRRNKDKSSPGRGRYQKSSSHNGQGRSDSLTKEKGKMEKTLDGKRAGLQNARELKEEISNFKRREDELFAKMGDKMSGKGAAAVVRDRRTGKRRNLEEEERQKEEDEKKLAVHKEKYSKWGKGLKQVEEQKENLQQTLHEMSKPLARYADDVDLERHLRDQEREGDPMLEYIRSKKTDDSTKTEPKYQGSFLPNRFGIPPGHRWDGVDRSNGYEKQWFEHHNSRKAVEEEAYKWSTSDM